MFLSLSPFLSPTDTEEEALSVEELGAPGVTLRHSDDEDATSGSELGDDVTKTTSSSSAISAIERVSTTTTTTMVSVAQTKRKVDTREEIVTKRGSQPSGEEGGIVV